MKYEIDAGAHIGRRGGHRIMLGIEPGRAETIADPVEYP